MSAGQTPDLARLDAEIMAAHDRDDDGALGRLYLAGGTAILATGAVDHGCFLLTQAYVFAMKSGDHGAVAKAHALLIDHGREA